MTIELGQVRKGTHVRTSDGADLGKVKEVWLGTDPTSTHARCDEEICSRLEVHHREGLFKDVAMYVPYSAIAEMSRDTVVLKVDEATARSKGWTTRPRWIGGDGPDVKPIL